MKIVILDDHQVIQEILGELVLMVCEKADLFYFTELLPAIQFISREKPNFVITDLQIADKKQLDVVRLCDSLKIPYMVYTGYVNGYIVNECDAYSCVSYVSKSSSKLELKTGIDSLFKRNVFRCSNVKKYMNRNPKLLDYIPEVYCTKSEEDVLNGIIEGETSEETANRLGKSIYTVRNQRISLMHKNECSIEEIIKRYLFWHKGA